MRVGLANSVTVFAVFWLGAFDAIVISMSRIVLASLLGGTFLGPAFFLSLGGGALSLSGMLLSHRFFSPPFGIVGISVIGASLHNVGQLAVLSLLFVTGYRVMSLVPVFILLSVPVGILVGVLGSILLRAARQVETGQVTTAASQPAMRKADVAL
jgi:heptaprenyl diphosphate synthase